MTPVIEDRTAAHQIAQVIDRGKIGVTCSCLAAPLPTAPSHRIRAGRRARYQAIIETRTRFPAADAQAVWRAWHETRGVEL